MPKDKEGLKVVNSRVEQGEKARGMDNQQTSVDSCFLTASLQVTFNENSHAPLTLPWQNIDSVVCVPALVAG